MRDESDFESNANAKCPACGRRTNWPERGCAHVCFIWEPERGYVHLDQTFREAALERLEALGVSADEFPALIAAWSDLGPLAKTVPRIFPELKIETKSYEAPAGHGSWFVAFGFTTGLRRATGEKAVRIVEAAERRRRAEKAKSENFASAFCTAPAREVLRLVGRRAAGAKIRGDWTALMLAAESGRRDLIPSLMRRGGRPLRMNAKKESAATVAIEKRQWGMLEAMLTRPVITKATRSEVRHIWDAAVRSADLRASRVLVKAGLPLTQADLNNLDWAILETAVRVGSLPYARWLMTRGARPTASAVWVSVRDSRPELTEALLTGKPDWTGILGDETIRGFFLYRSIDCLEVALKKGMPLDWRDYRGRSALDLVLEELGSPYSEVDKGRVLGLVAQHGSGFSGLTPEERAALRARVEALGVQPNAERVREKLDSPGNSGTRP